MGTASGVYVSVCARTNSTYQRSTASAARQYIEISGRAVYRISYSDGALANESKLTSGPRTLHHASLGVDLGDLVNENILYPKSTVRASTLVAESTKSGVHVVESKAFRSGDWGLG